jgi:pimeloyl-ACP methyl ester carboxylesterase
MAPPYGLDDMAEDAVELPTALGVRRAHIMGVSMGGMIAQQVAISHPDRVLIPPDAVEAIASAIAQMAQPVA